LFSDDFLLRGFLVVMPVMMARVIGAAMVVTRVSG